jgi:ADP-ribosylglycohydrolase
MLGAIAGDIIGSIYENLSTKRKDFKLFRRFSTYTDDTVLTVAVADAILTGGDYGSTIKAYARRHPFRGYGPRFLRWLILPGLEPYNSFGNGSAMRVSPVSHAFPSLTEVLAHARFSAECTHNHPEGIKGAQATAAAVYLARHGSDREQIRSVVENRFGYDLSRSIDSIRPDYKMDITCQGSVPEAIIAFLDSVSFEDALRNAVSLGGDADTQACIAGAIAEPFYKNIPEDILGEVRRRLPDSFWKTILAFYSRYGTEETICQIDRLQTG